MKRKSGNCRQQRCNCVRVKSSLSPRSLYSTCPMAEKAMISSKKPKLTHKLCPHCNKQLNLKSYKEHKRLHFDESSKLWHKEELDVSDSSSIVSLPDCDERCSDFSLESQLSVEDSDRSLEVPLEQSFDSQLTSNITRRSAEATTFQEGNYRATVMMEGLVKGKSCRKGN